jgi:hypothetical protein
MLFLTIFVDKMTWLLKVGESIVVAFCMQLYLHPICELASKAIHSLQTSHGKSHEQRKRESIEATAALSVEQGAPQAVHNATCTVP